MAVIDYNERMYFEKLFNMGTGYVMNFSDERFNEFLKEVGINIWEPKYNYKSGSKANRLRRLWEVESPSKIIAVLEKLLRYWKIHYSHSVSPFDVSLLQEDYNECSKIITKLKEKYGSNNLFDFNLEDFSENNMEILLESIYSGIEKNQPEATIDRLHTLVVEFLRSRLEKRAIKLERDKPLHSLYGEYLKLLESEGKIQAGMTTLILKSAISILEKFNTVRNNQSLAHANELLPKAESLLIYKNISALLEFINAVDQPIRVDEEIEKNNQVEDDLPF